MNSVHVVHKPQVASIISCCFNAVKCAICQLIFELWDFIDFRRLYNVSVIPWANVLVLDWLFPIC